MCTDLSVFKPHDISRRLFVFLSVSVCISRLCQTEQRGDANTHGRVAEDFNPLLSTVCVGVEDARH